MMQSSPLNLRRAVIWIGRLVIAGFFIYAGYAKILLLILGWQLRLWATLSTLLILGFFGAVVHAYAAGMQINCGCFATPEPLTIATVIRDGLLAALALLMTIFAFIEARKPHPWSPPSNA